MKVTIIVERPDCNVEVTEKPKSYATPIEVLIERAVARVRAALDEEGRADAR